MPDKDSPQWATVSASRNPGRDSSHWLVLMGICFFQPEVVPWPEGAWFRGGAASCCIVDSGRGKESVDGGRRDAH